MMKSKNAKLAYNVTVHDEPVQVEGMDALYSKLIEVTTGGWTPITVDVWGECLQCKETVRVEDHTHTHDCKLNDIEGCSWISPNDIANPTTEGLIPPVSINDWDYSLYIVDEDHGSTNAGKRTHRVNGVITYTDKRELLPEIGPAEPVETAYRHPYVCRFCERGFNSRLYYAEFHSCPGVSQLRNSLLQSDDEVQRPTRPVVLREAALTDNWAEADHNRVPSELGKLDWMNPRQD